MSTVADMDRTCFTLIERRLDAIERNLMESRVSREKRREIVQAAESQIHELLAAHDGELTREVVLQVLWSLDPPESYCGDEASQLPVRAARFVGPARLTLPPTGGIQPVPPAYIGGVQACPTGQCVQPKTSGFAFAALVLALLSIPAIILIPIGSILALAGAICGAVAWFQISASGGSLRGKWMAIFSFVIFAIHLCLICLVLASL